MIRMGDHISAYATITLRPAMMIEIFCGDNVLAGGSSALNASVKRGGYNR